MPKASLASKDAVNVSLGIQEGVIEVVKAVTKVHQYPVNRKSGIQSDPFGCVQLTVLKCDKDGQRIDDSESTIELSTGNLEYFHPGKAENADDNEPEDLGTEVDTEGNCIWAEDGKALSKSCKWIQFAESMEKQGFKPEVLGNGFMPDLVGTIMEVYTEQLPKPANSRSTKDHLEQLKAKRILRFPYEKKTKGAAKGAPKGAGKASAPAAAAAKAPVGDDPAALAVSMLEAVVAGNKGKTIERKKLATAVQMQLMRATPKIPVPAHKGVLDLVKDDDWLMEQLGDGPIAGAFTFDDDTVTFE